jgi:regulator of sigma E protease
MTSLWAFLLAISILVGVHEYGHYKAAVSLGVKVLRFSLGFGPVVFRSSMGAKVQNAEGVVRGETEFVISLIPLGGYVTFLDESTDPESKEDEKRAFHRQSLLTKSLIVAAGPMANLVLAVVLLMAMNWIGFESAAPVLSTPVEGSLASQTSMVAGARVIKARVKGEAPKEIESYAQFEKFMLSAVSSHQRIELDLQSEMGATKEPFTVALDLSTWTLPMPLPIPMPSAANAEQGNDFLVDQEAALQKAIVEDPRGVMTQLGFAGPFSQALIGRVSPGGAAAQAGLLEGDRVIAINDEPVADALVLRSLIAKSGQREPVEPQLWLIERQGQAKTLNIEVTPQRKMQGATWVGKIEAYVGTPPQRVWIQEGPMDALGTGFLSACDWTRKTIESIYQLFAGQTQLSQLGGPIALAKYAGESVHMGFAAFLSYLALVSINLAVFNLLPIPALDGGHLLCYGLEWVSGRKLSERFTQGFQKLGFLFVLALSIFALRNDLMRLWGLSP